MENFARFDEPPTRGVANPVVIAWANAVVMESQSGAACGGGGTADDPDAVWFLVVAKLFNKKVIIALEDFVYSRSMRSNNSFNTKLQQSSFDQ
jgi:hypothetical protein